MHGTKVSLRVFDNIAVLLAQGSFPGHFAAGLAEAQELVGIMINKLKEQADDSSSEETGHGAGSEAGTGGLDSGGVPNPGRKNRGRKKV